MLKLQALPLETLPQPWYPFQNFLRTDILFARIRHARRFDISLNNQYKQSNNFI